MSLTAFRCVNSLSCKITLRKNRPSDESTRSSRCNLDRRTTLGNMQTSQELLAADVQSQLDAQSFGMVSSEFVIPAGLRLIDEAAVAFLSFKF